MYHLFEGHYFILFDGKNKFITITHHTYHQHSPYLSPSLTTPTTTLTILITITLTTLSFQVTIGVENNTTRSGVCGYHISNMTLYGPCEHYTEEPTTYYPAP